jgi:hypothetical protein
MILRVSPQSRERRSGRRRLFTGGDVLKIATLFAVNGVGFPARYAATLADEVERRAGARLVGFDPTPGLFFMTWPFKDGSDWNRAVCYPGMEKPPHIPPAAIMIQVDGIIDETLTKLRAMINGEPVPDFAVPDFVPEPDPYSPENDFFMAWSKDDQGRNVRIGLTFEETEEYKRGEEDRRSGDRGRWLELHDRHETARLHRLQATSEERLAEALARPK